MKALVVGGAAQGKREFARRAYALEERELPVAVLRAQARGVDALHVWVRGALDGGGDPCEELARWLAGRGDWVVVCDEVGGGVVPLERAERDWREAVGRICCRLAAEADEVVRVCCGLPVWVKGGEESPLV